MTFTTWFESPEVDGAASAGAGYHVCLQELRELLDTGSAPPLVDADAAAQRLQSTYRAAIAAG